MSDAEHLIENAICDYEENGSFDRFLACGVNKGIRLETVTEMAYHVLHAFKPDWTEHNAD